MFETGGDPAEIVEAQGLAQISDSAALEALVAQVIADNPETVARYLEGKEGLLGWFVGQVMRETKGQANAQVVNDLFREKLGAIREK
jgi:Asp-tRNA(Asn)/Glu-tRNA(Gln) amidotransferase B subunit